MAETIDGLAPQPQPNPEVERQKLAERLGGVIGRLEALATKRIGQRQPLEDRWLEDLAQYHGRYDADTERKLNEGKKSKLFINQTRQKTDAMSARLMDLLFPTDDKNWGINPTPVPRMTAAAEKAEKAAAQLRQQVEDAQAKAAEAGRAEDPQLKQAADEATRKANELQLVIEEGRRRCDLMAAEIDDQLKESNYHAAKRDQIEDACKIGTGVTKGPVTGDKVRKGWQRQQVPATTEDGQQHVDEAGNPVMTEGDYALKMSDGESPAMRYVDIWSFFPDMDVRTVQDGEGVLERHLMNPKKLRCLARLKGFDKDAIRRLLLQKPKMAAPSYMATLRNISKGQQQVANEFYHVWEYSGPLSAEDMHDLAAAMGDDATLNDLGEVDPLTELNAIVWFCDGELLKFAIYPYDSGECLYSVFNLVKDESSVFGYGIPAIVRDAQKAMNAGWRAMMDNAGLATGPQIVIATEFLEPANGVWELEPRKIWRAKSGLPPTHRAFDAFNVEMHQNELSNIIALAKQFIDDETGMPQIAQGEQGTGVTKTAQGMALLMNSANVVFRRYVKNFDDDVTTPDIRRFYDWNMQFNPKEEIKGDYEVDARGSSVLLVREMQAQTLMSVATQLGGHPIYGPMLRNREILRKMFQALMIPAADVVLTDNEIDAVLANAASNDAAAQAAQAQAELQQRQFDFQEQELNAKIALAEMQADSNRQIAVLKHETAMMETAARMNMSLDQIEAKLADNREARASKERIFAAEVGVEATAAAAARANGRPPSGSGGYISA